MLAGTSPARRGFGKRREAEVTALAYASFDSQELLTGTAAGRLLRDRANFAGLVLGCIGTKFCK